jgi:tight adherence protein B
MSGRILALLPVIVFFAMLFLNPDFMRPMLTQPIGHFMLGYAACSAIIGYWVMMRFANVDV